MPSSFQAPNTPTPRRNMFSTGGPSTAGATPFRRYDPQEDDEEEEQDGDDAMMEDTPSRPQQRSGGGKQTTRDDDPFSYASVTKKGLPGSSSDKIKQEPHDGEGSTEEDDYASMPSPPPRHTDHSQLPEESQLFLAHNPASLIVHANQLLASLAQTLLPSTEDEEYALPHSSFGLPAPPSGSKKAALLAKSVNHLLGRLQGLKLSDSDGEGNLADTHYLASLLLLLHHPTISNKATRMPPSPLEIFKSFISINHPGVSSAEVANVRGTHPPVAHPSYWDVVASLLLRGDIRDVETLLVSGGWENIPGDGPGGFQYTDEEVSVIERVMNTLNNLISIAPPLLANTKAEAERYAEWRIWRGRIYAGIEELKGLSHSTDAGDDYADPSIPTVGGRGNLHAKPRRAGLRGFNSQTTRIPREVEAGVMRVYNMLVGRPEPILSLTREWETAVLGVAIWGRYLDNDDMEDEPADPADLLGAHVPGTANIKTGTAGPIHKGNSRQRRRERRARGDWDTLKSSFHRVTASEKPIDATSIREQGLAYILQNDWKAVVDILTLGTDTLPGLGAHSVAEFILEIASLAEWTTEGCEAWLEESGVGIGSLLSGFRDDEWAVTSAAPRKEVGEGDGEGVGVRGKRGKWEKEVVYNYVTELVKIITLSRVPRDDLISELNEEDEEEVVEGWEVAMSLISRWARMAGEGGEYYVKLASEILQQIPVSSPTTAEKLLSHCTLYGFQDTAVTIATSYAHQLLGEGFIGDALIYFSRAGDRNTIHSILTTLIELSLLLSSSYPPLNDLDPTLQSLLSAPGELDELLRFELSGYATLRTFYDSRDSGEKHKSARALVALLRSAGEQIDGGRAVDAGWVSAVEWWVGGVLVGELLPFLNGPKRMLSQREIFDTLKVIQDLTGAIISTWSAAEVDGNPAAEFLRNSLAAFKEPGRVAKLLQDTKRRLSISSSAGALTSPGLSGSWHQVGRPDSPTTSESNPSNNTELTNLLIEHLLPSSPPTITRTHDWRSPLLTNPNISDVLRQSKNPMDVIIKIARVGLAKEIGRCWLDGEGDLGVAEIPEGGGWRSGVGSSEEQSRNGSEVGGGGRGMGMGWGNGAGIGMGDVEMVGI